jgi:hypothetical protein
MEDSYRPMQAMAELSFKTDLISPFIALNILYNRYRFDIPCILSLVLRSLNYFLNLNLNYSSDCLWIIIGLILHYFVIWDFQNLGIKI